jgi:hypothetical protein
MNDTYVDIKTLHHRWQSVILSLFDILPVVSKIHFGSRKPHSHTRIMNKYCGREKQIQLEIVKDLQVFQNPLI